MVTAPTIRTGQNVDSRLTIAKLFFSEHTPALFAVRVQKEVFL